MELKINFMFLMVLIIACMVFLTYAYGNYQSIKVINRNAEYKHIDRETERDFNRWDFKRQAKLDLGIGILIFFIIIIYIFFSIKFYNIKKIKSKQVKPE